VTLPGAIASQAAAAGISPASQPSTAAVSAQALPIPPSCELQAYQALRSPSTNRGLATTAEARLTLKLQGLLPTGQASAEVEVLRAKAAIDRASTALEKYQAIMMLLETDRKSGFTLLQLETEAFLPFIYTPTVGARPLLFERMNPLLPACPCPSLSTPFEH
jgi:hypothetical protein